MTIRFTDHGPGSKRLQPLARLLTRIAGVGLMLVAVVTSIPAVWLGFAGLVELVYQVFGGEPVPGDPYSGDPFDFIPVSWWPFIAGAWIVSVVAFFASRTFGLKLLRANRHQVLFLRRFGYAPATHVVTTAVTQVGTEWRLVTLDDHRIAAVGVGEGPKLAARGWQLFSKLGDLSILGKMAAATVVSVLIGIAAWWSGVEFLAQLSNPIAVMVGTLLVGPGLVVIGSAMTSISEADKGRTITIEREEELKYAPWTVRKAVRRTYAARLLVVRVVLDALWQRAVTRFAVDASVALIDISEPTENVLWEIELLALRVPRPCVFVAERTWAEKFARNETPDDIERRLHGLLNRQQVLTYGIDTDAVKQFTRALRGCLEHETGKPRRPFSPPFEQVLTAAAKGDPPSLTHIVRRGEHAEPTDWNIPWIDAHGNPELAPGEVILHSFNTSLIVEELRIDPLWHIRSGFRVFVTSQRVIWVAEDRERQPLLVAGQGRHIWISSMVCRRPKRLRDRDSSMGLLALSMARPRHLGHCIRIDIPPRQLKAQAKKILSMVYSAASAERARVLPNGHVYAIRRSDEGKVRWKGVIGSGKTGLPAFIGRHMEPLEEGAPDRLREQYMTLGPPAGYRPG